MPSLAWIRKTGKAISKPMTHVWNELLMPIAMWKANNGIRKREISAGGPIAQLDQDNLTKLIDAEWTRGKEIDDKLQKLTAALSVSITVGGLVGSTMLQDLVASGWKIAAAVLFLLSAVLMLTGVLIGFNGLRPKPRYGYGAGYMNIIANGGDEARKEMIAAARHFERDNQIRANEAVAAIISIRNGVLAFAGAMLIGLIATGFGKQNQLKTNTPVEENTPAGGSESGSVGPKIIKKNHPFTGRPASRPNDKLISSKKRYY